MPQVASPASQVVDLNDPLTDKISNAVAQALSTHLPKAMETAVEKADVVKKNFGPTLEAIAKDQATQKANHTALSERTNKLEAQIKSTQQTLAMHLQDLETMAHNVQYIYDFEQAAMAPFSRCGGCKVGPPPLLRTSDSSSSRIGSTLRCRTWQQARRTWLTSSRPW